MLFKRKNKKSFLRVIRDIIWPRSGWKRSFLYIKHRLVRIPHSTRDIAMGLASGCVVSWTPTFPFQILQCLIFCRVFKASFPAALLGTIFGNPWTFPILFMIAYHVGQFFLDITGLEDFFIMLAGETELFKQDGFGVEKFLPTLVGGYMMAVLTFPIFYYGFYYMIEAARAAKYKVGRTAHVISEKVHDIKEHRKEKKEHK